jgi:hypothetical protein
MDRSHTVGMCKYKAKYSFSLGQISLIFLGRFCALNFSVLRLTHWDCTLRTNMDLRPIVTYLLIKDMNAGEFSANMNDTLGADKMVLEDCPFSSLRPIAKRILISVSAVRCHLVPSL